MAKVEIIFTVADLPQGPFGGDREAAERWLAAAATKLRDRLAERGNEILDMMLDHDRDSGLLRDDDDSESFYEYFEGEG